MNKKTSEPSHPMGIKSLPYGLTNFGRIRSENFYYIDKTSFIPELEKAGSYLFFIRPRRFGKTLLMSMLSAYYDISYKDQFEELFKGTWIYDNPTREKHSYFVLAFDFSQVNPGFSKVDGSFLEHVKGQVESFLKKYMGSLGQDGEELLGRIYDIETASDVLASLSRLCRDKQMQTYVLIDEYDNFANTILSSSGTDAYHDLTHGEGFYRAFFNVLKGGTSQMEAPFTRILLTGVSPITLDDVTSGYNIGENVSLDAAFNRMLGFSEEEVVRMLDYYSSCAQLPPDTGEILTLIKDYYGNYLFSRYEKGNVRIFNPDMVLYFLKEYFKNHSQPDELIDDNVKTDYGKLRHLILIDKGKIKKTNGNFSRIKEIIEEGYILAHLKKNFPLKKLTDPNNFISLLFYFGLLSITEPGPGLLKLAIPNETIRHMYYEYILEGYEETGVFSLDMLTYERLMDNMAKKGQWLPLVEFITGRMKESMSLRDLITGEKAIQAFLNVYLGLSDLYIIHPERETNKGYVDILMEPFLVQYPDIRYSYMIEIKYINRAAARPPSKTAVEKGKQPPDQEIKKLVTEAEDQLRQYSLDEKLAKTLGKTTLIKLVLVFCGHEAVYINEVK